MTKYRRNLDVGRLIVVVVAAIRSYFEIARFRRLRETDRSASPLPRLFVRRVLKLGPLYIKLGQILSTRPDVLPEQYVSELQRLQEHVPPMSFADVDVVVGEEFKTAGTASVFAGFEQVPIASASLSQVHFATLPDGKEVAVKVQRRGAEESILCDLRVLEALLDILVFFAPRMARNFNLRGGFFEFQKYTLQELDFSIEAMTLDAFRHNFVDWPDVVIPAPHHEYVTRRVLTMQRVSGERVDVIVERLSTEERHDLGRRLLEIEMKMFISDGLFHADMHPGNIFFNDDGSIVLLDFGMYGRLTQEHRDHFMLYWFYGIQRRTKSAFRHLIAQTERLPGADEDAYLRYFNAMAERFYQAATLESSLTQTYLQIISAGAKYGFIYPSDLLLQAKALTTAEALAFVLTPDLRFEDEAQPIIAREFVRRASNPRRLRRRLESILPELLLFGQLPPEQYSGEGGDDEIAARLWASAGVEFVKQMGDARWEAELYRELIEPIAASAMAEAKGTDGEAVVEGILERISRRRARGGPV